MSVPVFLTLTVSQEDARRFLHDHRIREGKPFLLTGSQENEITYEVLTIEGQEPCPHEYEDDECVWCEQPAQPLPSACMAGVCVCPSQPDGYDQHVVGESS